MSTAPNKVTATSNASTIDQNKICFVHKGLMRISYRAGRLFRTVANAIKPGIRKTSMESPAWDSTQQELTLQEYDQRLKSMSEAIRALYEKFEALQLTGRWNTQTMSQFIGSIPNDDHFSVDDSYILATILKQNIALQKPELARERVPQVVK